MTIETPVYVQKSDDPWNEILTLVGYKYVTGDWEVFVPMAFLSFMEKHDVAEPQSTLAVP